MGMGGSRHPRRRGRGKGEGRRAGQRGEEENQRGEEENQSGAVMGCFAWVLGSIKSGAGAQQIINHYKSAAHISMVNLRFGKLNAGTLHLRKPTSGVAGL